MRIHVGTLADYRARAKLWRPWFAWRPVTIDGTLVWLEQVERRYLYSYDDGWHEYRFPKEAT